MTRFRVDAVRIVALIMCVCLMAAACTSPLADDEPDATQDAIDAVTSPTPAQPIRIVTPTPVDPTAVAEATQAAPSEQRPEVYVVAENDTLYGIAVRFRVDIAVLVELNGLSDPNDIRVGQELIIPPED